METISFQSLRQSGREVNSIGGRQLSSGAPTPWIPGSDYPCAPVFSLPQQRPFWKARKGTIAQRRVTHIPFLKHHSSHTFGINRRIFCAALYWSLSNLREDFKSVQLYLKGICYRGCLCRRQRNPVWPTNTQHRQEKRPSAKKLEHNLAQMGGVHYMISAQSACSLLPQIRMRQSSWVLTRVIQCGHLENIRQTEYQQL